MVLARRICDVGGDVAAAFRAAEAKVRDELFRGSTARYSPYLGWVELMPNADGTTTFVRYDVNGDETERWTMESIIKTVMEDS